MNLVKGMDVSLAKELEQSGAVYGISGKKMDLFQLLHRCGCNLIRLRLWVNPYSETGESYGGGENDLATTMTLARRAKNNQMPFMLDFHYSDFWADPAKQIKPKAWRNLSGDALVHQVYQYTKSVMLSFQDVDLLPQYVQVGNEITNGLLWPDGDFKHPAGMAALLCAGTRAVREISPTAKIVFHLDFGTDNQMYRKWFSSIEPFGLDFDVIGMSYYPHWNGSMEKLLWNMNDISGKLGKEVMITETSIGYTTDSLGCKGIVFSQEQAQATGYPATEAGQEQFLRDLFQTVRRVQGGRGLGVVYWEPAWLPIPKCTWTSRAGQLYLNDAVETGNANANQALFQANGNANLALLHLEKM